MDASTCGTVGAVDDCKRKGRTVSGNEKSIVLGFVAGVVAFLALLFRFLSILEPAAR